MNRMSENVKQPYIGVSGVVRPEQQEMLESMYRVLELEQTERILALGVKAVHKTQFLDIENKYGPDWYPIGAESFSKALNPSFANSNTIGVAQTYLDAEHVTDAKYRKEFVSRISKRGNKWIQGIQFDLLPWHADDAVLGFLADVKEEYGVQVFLQCHSEAMQELGPKGVTNQLTHYEDVVDYVLFDASHGTGKRLDATALEPFIEQAYESFDIAKTGIALAGGLNADVVREDLPQIVVKYPDISWDAEAQLHIQNEKGERPLGMWVTREYLQASASILAS